MSGLSLRQNISSDGLSWVDIAAYIQIRSMLLMSSSLSSATRPHTTSAQPLAPSALVLRHKTSPA